MPDTFNPHRVAYFEATGWRAYYDRAWFKLLRLTADLMQEQFKIPFPRSYLAAYYVARASLAWAPNQNSVDGTRRYLQQFYRLARRYSSLQFDPEAAAEKELRYWDLHRKAGQGVSREGYVECVAALHEELFGVSTAAAESSAIYRVRAADLVDGITGARSVDVEGDWKRLEAELRLCYEVVHDALTSHSGQMQSLRPGRGS